MQLRPRFISRLPSAAAILQEIRASVWTGGCILAGGREGITDPLPSRVAKEAILLFSPASMPQKCPSISTRKGEKTCCGSERIRHAPLPPRLTCTHEGRFQIRISCYFFSFFPLEMWVTHFRPSSSTTFLQPWAGDDPSRAAGR